MGQLIKCYKHKNIVVTGNSASYADVLRGGLVTRSCLTNQKNVCGGGYW